MYIIKCKKCGKKISVLGFNNDDDVDVVIDSMRIGDSPNMDYICYSCSKLPPDPKLGYVYLIKYNNEVIAVADSDDTATAAIVEYMKNNKDMVDIKNFEKEAVRFYGGADEV